MNGLPADFDTTPLAGRILELVCVSETQAYLHFSGEFTICIESSFSERGNGDWVKHNVPPGGASLLKYLGQGIAEARTRGGKDLLLVFGDGAEIMIHDDQVLYESYNITLEGRVIYV